MNAIASTYTILDDAIHTKTDTAWNNPLTREAKLKVTVNDAKLVLQIENARINIETMLREREIRNRSLTSNDSLIAELDTVESEVNVVKNYLNDLSLAWSRSLADNNVSQATIEGFKASTGVARASVTSALSVISGTRTALNASLSANQIAEINSSTIGTDSGSSADGQVKSALGNLRGAQARLEQTIVRSPIGGTINSLSISTGDFVSPYTEVAVVSNNGTLEIIAYVTEEDAQFLVVEGTVTIEGGSTGVITRIAPALDPKTNKIEVRIGITNGTALLTNGASVRISANRAIKQAIQGENKIPLSALKITPGGAVVFSVSASSTLVAHSVSLGSLLGDEVQISAGLTPEMMIVTDARGLQDGMVVSLK
ncbi:MAG: Secretion protein HlyD [Parcubacteria group bacterium GW2011_GWA2_47_7]|nr:MAG: Secretion protein HlyD [Parcubacteria group bacterium GW2011_GWA2_47_7]